MFINTHRKSVTTEAKVLVVTSSPARRPSQPMASAIGYEAVAIGAANTTIHMNRWAAENGSNSETPNTIAGSTISLSANVGTITFASARNSPRWRRPPQNEKRNRRRNLTQRQDRPLDNARQPKAEKLKQRTDSDALNDRVLCQVAEHCPHRKL